MRNKFYSIIIILSIFSISFIESTNSYDRNYVEISTVKHNKHSYKLVYLKRGASGRRLKAKYFAAKDPFTGATVPQRYAKWSKNKNIICYSSGTYMNSYDFNAKPVGITVDNGIIVNRNIKKDMDGLVIVYATGGIVATNLKNKDLVVQGGDISGIKLDIRGNSLHKQAFLKWCQDNSATVFQTHLLVFNNKLIISKSKSSPEPRERRFLVVGTDNEGKIVHCIVHSPEYTSLYEGSNRVLNFLNSFKEMKVIFIVNLDPGAQDVFRVYNSDGTINNALVGRLPINRAINLITYYYE